MTVYNGAAFLRPSVESVLEQSFDDFEFLIIDDTSTDESVELVRSYSDPRIRLVLNDHNIGQAASLNKGLELACGDYIARLDQDDVCLPGRFRAQVRLLEERSDVAMVGSWVYSINPEGRKVRRWRPRIDNFGSFVGQLTLGLTPVWHPSVMYRRQAILTLRGYDPAYAPAEDYDLWTKVAGARLNGAVVCAFLTAQRVHDTRQSIKGKAVQEDSLRRSHDRLLASFSDFSDIESLGLLLRLEEGFLRKCRTRRQLVEALAALDGLLLQMRVSLELSDEEFSAFRKLIYRRLGTGIRLGTKLGRLPFPLFYLFLVGLSPMLLASLQRPAAFLKQRLPELRYLRRLF